MTGMGTGKVVVQAAWLEGFIAGLRYRVAR